MKKPLFVPILKITVFKKIIFPALAVLLLHNTGFAQCPSSTNILFQNFNAGAGTFNSGATGTAAGTETKGAYASFSGNVDLTNNADACCAAGPDDWRENLTADPSVLPTGNDGGTSSDYAMLVDGAMPNGSFWCATVTVSPGEIYDFSAFYTSPWLQDKANDPGLYFTINGVQLGSTAIVDQYNPTTGAPQPYTQQECYYTIPAGTSGSVQFCLNLIESTGCTGIPTTTVGGGCTYPPGSNQGQGNDILVDDISIKKCNSGGSTSGCTYSGTTLQAELLSFDVQKESNNTASLKWVTASEKNSAYFSIEKSEDGIHYERIGIVNAQGNSSNLITYEFEDRQFNSTSYYRLQMVDKDGSYKYSRVTSLKKDEYARIISNPDKGELQINALVAENTRWNIAVYSLLGQEYLNEKVSLVKGENTILKQISRSEQSAKIVRITADDGTVILSEVVLW
jgi:hypothetical protein